MITRLVMSAGLRGRLAQPLDGLRSNDLGYVFQLFKTGFGWA
ncbi:hypothetical protein QO058_13115 [Bosea vestrisii]|nr:hypothetical protein [Bosea vestrisii]WID99101.1 hypothetical protein QO058_13115 [Bosea vestrisii]